MPLHSPINRGLACMFVSSIIPACVALQNHILMLLKDIPRKDGHTVNHGEHGVPAGGCRMRLQCRWCGTLALGPHTVAPAIDGKMLSVLPTKRCCE